MNLCVVESPFQLLSAYEASLSFSDCKTLFVVKHTTEVTNNDQMKSLISLFGIQGDVIEVSSSSFSLFINLKLLWLLKRLNASYKFKRVFIGEYRSFYMRKYLDFFNTAESYCLDDGNVSYSIAESIDQKKDLFYSLSIKGFIKKIAFVIINLPFKAKGIKTKREINMFTCFDIKKKFIIKHNFNNIKKTIKQKKTENGREIVYFYGTNLSILGIDYHTEKKMLEKAILKLSEFDSQVMYIPHRRESKKKISMLEKDIGLHILNIKYPAEIDILISSQQPTIIASFGSSVLLTLPNIYKEIHTAIAFLPSMKLITRIHKDEWTNLEKKYTENCKVIKIDD